MSTHRREKVASVIREIVSSAIAYRLNDPRIEPMTTVTRVEVTRDLLIADVYVTVPGAESAERRTILAIQHAAGYVKRLVARELSLRQCPEVRFKIDERTKGAKRTMEILAENRRRHPEVFQSDDEPLPIDDKSKSPIDGPADTESDASGGTSE